MKFIPFGITKIVSPTTSISLTIPKFSIFKQECCMFSISFKSIQSKVILQYQLDNIMKNYEEYVCNNKKYYYDEVNDITISEYGVKNGFLFNEFYITYDKGKMDTNYCSKIKKV